MYVTLIDWLFKEDGCAGGTCDFLFCMQHKSLGIDYPMSKQQLEDAAESSGISRATIKSTTGPVGVARPGAKPQFGYCGWNNFSTLYSKDPPLVQKYSNPMKIRLTPEVIMIAVHLQP